MRSRTLMIASGIALTGMIVGYAFVFVRNPEESDWYCCYVRAALKMQQGEPIHVVDACPYAYPPLMALLTVPLAQLPPAIAIVCWYALCVTGLGVALWYAWLLAGGPVDAIPPRRWVAVGLLGLVCSMRFVVGPLETRQFDTIIAAVLMAGCWRLCHARQQSAGLLLGLAAAMKCTPLLLVPYLAYRRMFRAAVLVVATAVAANLLPDVCFPQRSGRLYLVDWKHRFLDVSQRVPPGTWFSGLAQNQSLAGTFQRLFRYGLPLSREAVSHGKLSPDAVPLLRTCVYLADATLLAATAWLFVRRGRASRLETLGFHRPANNPLHVAVEVSAVFALMLLVSPMTSRAHYLILILPALLACRMALIERDPFCRWMLPVLLVCGPLATKGLVGKMLGDMSLAWSLPTWFALATLLCMWRLLRNAVPVESSKIARLEPTGSQRAARVAAC